MTTAPHPLLTEYGLLEALSRHDDLDALGLESIRPTLRVLLAGITREAGLNAARAERAGQRIFRALRRRASILRLVQTHPEIREEPIDAPIFLSGLNFAALPNLHTLLAAHPSLRAWSVWEMANPVAPPEADLKWSSLALQATDVLMKHLQQNTPGLQSLHATTADRPGACHWLLQNCLVSPRMAFLWHMPRYLRWLMDEVDFTPTYPFFRLQLQALQWRARRRGEPRRTMLLCDVLHQFHPEAIRFAFPDARFVLLQDDPERTANDLRSLCRRMHLFDSGRTASLDIGAYVAQLMYSSEHRAERQHVIDVRHLQQHPMPALQALLDTLALPADGGSMANIRAWVVEHRREAIRRQTLTDNNRVQRWTHTRRLSRIDRATPAVSPTPSPPGGRTLYRAAKGG
ncbi:MAG: sulfotransferase [Myxococcota bacterium]